jgi:PIN domain nuclease of toxin-antitoxin system
LVLVDTHVVIWLALEPERISKKARIAIEETRRRGDGLAISNMTLLEIAMIANKNRITLNSTLESFLSEVESRFIVLPISARICVRALGLPANFPNDPADRIIAATALVEGILLVTADTEIQRSKALRTLW